MMACIAFDFEFLHKSQFAVDVFSIEHLHVVREDCAEHKQYDDKR